jgi:[ribosomal protein S5]-alanine N-acetyltransferase
VSDHPVTKVLETDRLLLRDLTIGDLDALASLYSDPDVRRFFPEGALTYEETREELEWIIDVYYGRYGYGLWATIDKATGGFIGRCGLLPWKIMPPRDGVPALAHADEHPRGTGNLEVELAYMLSKENWRKGFGTEVGRAIVDYGFEHLHLPRIICLFDPENVASRKVAENVGMTYESEVELDGDSGPLYSISAERARALKTERR